MLRVQGELRVEKRSFEMGVFDGEGKGKGKDVSATDWSRCNCRLVRSFKDAMS